jgi:hypothetical protein
VMELIKDWPWSSWSFYAQGRDAIASDRRSKT